MKKLSKLIVFLLILVMGAGFIPASALSSVFAVAIAESTTLSINDAFINEGKIGVGIFVPKAAASTGTATVKAINPNGVDVTTTELAINGENYLLTPTLTGVYNIVYGVSGATLNFETKETSYQILVTGNKPTMSFEENSKFIIPSTIGDNTAIVLPYPTVIGADGNEVSLENVIANTQITITKPAGVTGDINRTTQLVNEKNYVKFTTVEGGNGIYTVSYRYVDPTVNTLTVSKSFEIVASTTYEAAEEFTASRSGSIPTALELGETITLPTYTLKDKDGNVLQSYTTIEAKFIPANSTGTDHVDCNAELDGYEFTPTHQAKNGSIYQIVYKLYDFANLNETAVVTKTHTITSVKDTTSPTPYPVADYDTIEANVLNADEYYLDNAEYLVPSKVAKGETKAIPAIFARDAYNVSLPTNLTLKRTITTPENVQDTTFVDNDATKSINYTFALTGTYTVKYSATDEANNINTNVSYDIKVEEGFTDAIAPKINIASVVPSYAKEGTLIKFLKPTAIDYATELSTETSVNDSRTKIETYYYTNDVDAKTVIEEYETDKDYLAFNIPTIVTGNTLTIFVKATDDYNNVSTKTITINLPYVSDSSTPSVSGVAIDRLYNQSDVVELQTIAFTDDNIEYVTVSVDVIDAEGNYVDVYGLTSTLTNNVGIKLEAKNAKFVPTVAGDYTVVYTVKDPSGKSCVFAYKTTIVDDILPVVPGPSVWTDNLEVGVSTFLPSSIVTDRGEEITNSSLTKIEVVSTEHSSNFELNNVTLEFVSYVAGTYEFRYIGQDASGNEAKSKTYTLTVKDSYKPDIELTNELKATYDLTKTGDVYNDITIPGFAATDVHYDDNNNLVSRNNIVQKYISIKDPNFTNLDIKIEGVSQNSTEVSTYADEYGFTPTKAGTYTITYYAKDAAGNETTLEKTIKVGDHVAPNITIDQTEIDLFDGEFKVGDTLALDMSKISATDDDITTPNIDFDTIKTGTTATKLVAVKVVNPSGTTVYRVLTADNSASTDETPIYELSQAGSYTVTYTVKDNTGNTSTKVFTIVVDAEEENVVIGTEVWGIILIIVAIAILAGIVIYFIKTRKVKAKPTAIIRK